MRWRRFALVLALLLAGAVRLRAQVVQMSGYGSSVDGTEGASLSVYGEGNTSRLSLGAAQGLHVGVSREVAAGTTHLTLGDSQLSLALPSDTDDGTRTVYGTGALLQLGSPDRQVAVFAGQSGQNYGNAFFSGVTAQHALLLSSATMRTGRVTWHNLMVRGERRANISTARWRVSARTAVALSAGMSAGHAVFRGTLHHEAKSWRVDVSDTSGHLQLQPQRTLQLQQLERIGLNIAASKRIGQRLWIDAARHEYATGTTDLPDNPAPATTGARSVLLEAGATAHLGSLSSGVRVLQSSSGTAHDHAAILIESWHRGGSSVQVMMLHRTDPLGSTTTTLQVDAGRQIDRHVQVQTGAVFGNGSPHLDVGGTVAGNWGSLSVSHGETYVPFGGFAGFHRVLSVGVRLHARNAEVGVTHLSATGIPGAWQGNVNDFEGSGEGNAASATRTVHALPKYRLQGTVMDDGKPLPGAAVAVGSQTVYTDSDGHWMARFERANPVRVVLQPGEFLTVERYRSLTEARIETPARDGAPLELRAARCPRGAVAVAPAQGSQDDAAAAPRRRSLLQAIGSLGMQVLRVWPHRRPAGS